MSAVQEIKQLKVAKGTKAKELATSITIEVSKHKKVTLSCIGAGAINNAVKGVAIARGRLAAQGCDVWSYPVFQKTQVENDAEEKTGIIFMVEDRQANQILN